MTDNEIIKALECCNGWDGRCLNCPLNREWTNCKGKLNSYTLDLIKRQKAEIERLEKKANTPFAEVTFDESKLKEIVDEYVKNIEININLAKSEAIKEFAERLRNCFCVSKEYLDIMNIIDNLVKEMTEVNENDKT